MSGSKDFDVILWGATGFTGRLVAEFLAERYGVDGAKLRWTLAGRNESKLMAVREALIAMDPKAAELPLLLADSRDRASLDALTARTKVICTTVGPYAQYGTPLVEACVDAGIDYCDLTGETPWIRQNIDALHETAEQKGARIVHCCGYDSIPSDLGVLMLHEHARDNLKEALTQATTYVVRAKGGFSGGTVASMVGILEQAKDREVRRVLGNPYSLVPDHQGRGPDGSDQLSVRYDADLGSWTGPFVMAAINSRIVRRSNALLEYAYGRGFRYNEVMALGKGAAGWSRAAGVTAGLGGFVATMQVPPLRAALRSWVLPSPGEGPSKAQREAGYFKHVVLAKTESGQMLRGRVEGDKDPGYGATAMMLAESAVCLAQSEDIPNEGGILTPASAMGAVLTQRLRDIGMRWIVDA